MGTRENSAFPVIVPSGFFASNPPSITQSAQGVLTRFEKAQPAKVGAAPFQSLLQSQTFNAVDDPYFFIGYNAERGAGGAGVAAEPTIYWGLEAAYNDGVNLLMEWYVNYNSADNSTVVNFRPIGGQVVRNNNNSWEAHTVFDLGHDAGAFLNIQTDPTAVLWSVLPTQSLTYMPFTVSRQDTGSQAQLKLNTRLGDAAIIFQDNGGFNWEYVLAHSGNFRMRDLVNNRDQVTYTAGASSAAAITEFASTVKVDGELTTVASATGAAGFTLPHGVAPTAPVNGDMWSTTAGLFIRVNGVTKTVTLT